MITSKEETTYIHRQSMFAMEDIDKGDIESAKQRVQTIFDLTFEVLNAKTQEKEKDKRN